MCADNSTCDQMQEHLTRRYIETRLSLIDYAAGHTLDQLLTRALDEVGKLAESPIGYYCFPALNQETLSLQPESGRTLKTFYRTEGHELDPIGAWADCVHRKKPVVHNDYTAPPRKKGMPRGHAGIIREMVVPVMREGEVVAILAVGDKPTAYTQQDVDIVAYLADVTWEIVLQKRADNVLQACRREHRKLEQQYRQAQKLESIGQSTGGIAHDLNNLLTPIIGYGEILIENTSDRSKNLKPLKEIVKAGMRAQELARQLLAFSRKQTLEFKSVALNPLLQNFKGLLRRTIREDVSIRFIPGDSLPLIRGDAGQLEQVIMNLAVNAQDAMPAGGTLTIETAQTELDEHYAGEHPGVMPGSYVMLVVRDTGCGMASHVRERLYEPFFTTKSKENGTGLGLATVYGIVKQHRGSIVCHSVPDRGTTFHVYLPVVTQATTPQPSLLETPHIKQGSETILLVEDDEQVRQIAKTILEQKGYQVLLADSGNHALRLIDQHTGPLHLLLTDVVMPEMNGKELHERLMQKRPNLKTLYMSGYTGNVIAQRGVMDADLNFLSKPFTVAALTHKVREVLDQ